MRRKYLSSVYIYILIFKEHFEQALVWVPQGSTLIFLKAQALAGLSFQAGMQQSGNALGHPRRARGAGLDLAKGR